MRNTLVKKSFLGVGMRSSRYLRDTEAGTGGGGDDGTTGDDSTDGADDGADEGGDGEEGKGEKGSEKPKFVSEAKFLQVKRHLQEADRKRQAAEDELKALKTKDLPEAEKVAAELKEAQESAASYKDKYEKQARTNAFLRASVDLKVNWKNATAALKLAELEDLTINEDGSVDGIKDAVKGLAKDHPYLVDDATEENGSKAPSKSGSPVGSKQSAKKPAGHLDEEELKRRFPALY